MQSMLSCIIQDSLKEQNQENDIYYKRSHVRLSYTIGTGQSNMAVIMLGPKNLMVAWSMNLSVSVVSIWVDRLE